MTPPQSNLEDHKQLLRHQYDEVGANGNVDVLDETCSQDVVLYGIPTTGHSADIRAFKDFVETCSGAFSNLSNDVEDVVAEDDRVVVRSTLGHP
jgi:ketosteroid isomerase-like protein